MNMECRDSRKMREEMACQKRLLQGLSERDSTSPRGALMRAYEKRWAVRRCGSANLIRGEIDE